MSPITQLVRYGVRCDICGQGYEGGFASEKEVREDIAGVWLVIGDSQYALTICNRHELLDAKPCHSCGTPAGYTVEPRWKFSMREFANRTDMWAGNCRECWNEAMKLPRGTCCIPWRWGPSCPADEFGVHECDELPDHVGNHRCQCDARWSRR